MGNMMELWVVRWSCVAGNLMSTKETRVVASDVKKALAKFENAHVCRDGTPRVYQVESMGLVVGCRECPDKAGC